MPTTPASKLIIACTLSLRTGCSCSSSWNLRFYGLAYKLPNISTSDLDSLIDGLSTNDLNSTQQQLLQNRTQDLASIPIPKANLTALVFANGSSITNSSGIQLQTADDFGEFVSSSPFQVFPTTAVLRCRSSRPAC